MTRGDYRFWLACAVDQDRRVKDCDHSYIVSVDREHVCFQTALRSGDAMSQTARLPNRSSK